MVLAAALADVIGRDAAVALAMADVVHVHLFPFETGDAGVVVAEFVDGEGDDVGESGDERGEQHLDVAGLAVEGAHVVGEVAGVEFRNVLFHDVGHFVHLAVAHADVFDGLRVVADLALLDAVEAARQLGLVAADEFEQLAFELIADLAVVVGRDRLEDFIDGDLRRAEGIVRLLRAAGREAHGDGVESAAGVAATGRETGEFNVFERRGEQLREFEIDGRPLDRAEAFVRLEHAERRAPRVVADGAHFS